MKKSPTSKKMRTDFSIRAEDIDLSEDPELTPEMFRHKVVGSERFTEPSDEVTLRIDRDVLQWFQSRPGWEHFINFLLRSYMQEQQRKWAKSEKPKARRA